MMEIFFLASAPCFNSRPDLFTDCCIRCQTKMAHQVPFWISACIIEKFRAFSGSNRSSYSYTMRRGYAIIKIFQSYCMSTYPSIELLSLFSSVFFLRPPLNTSISTASTVAIFCGALHDMNFLLVITPRPIVYKSDLVMK